MTIVKVSFEQLKKSKGKTSKSEVEKISESEILESALNDPDSSIPTEEELKEFKKPKERK
ncbi:hypothetical protein [Pseudoalteromonas sp. B62]|jgi:hypothetical protein|uniref:hypothetical protein n=1 Tax=Pseudoalteromonas sp. B62 TaxID=630483 RepID=UPI00301CFBEE